MKRDWKYTKGLHDLGNGHYAWLMPDGSWGWSNAGLVEDGGQTLLVKHDLYPSKEALDAELASGAADGLPEQLEQLDELLVTLGG